ncbi:GNAT family N-acetyltransferase [Actinoplanes sp. DH11]|uniref:GNAT family N-acetyltransferase n=1 Tax=Actinoplanes sp. DH11 TaxID=2857011 RepID=UPI001E35EC85|nr:GNAT family N-acetyltransferase [Actinoplanes sp. DH11]
MDHQSTLALFDRQMRQAAPPETSSTTIEADDRVVRHLGGDQGWNAVLWSGLDEESADEAIAAQIEFFGSREFEWKLYGHDRPADLGDRLRTAGFVPEEQETLMIAAIGDLDLEVTLPDGVRLEPVTDAAGVELLLRAHEDAFGESADWLRPRVLAQLAESPENVRLVVALAGDRPISGARMDLNPGTAFASLWGGGTAPGWRGRGVYRALVAHRARIAAELGYEYLQVDASDQSRPILQRLGFAALTTTTPYQWRPLGR